MELKSIIDALLNVEGWPQYTNRPSDKGGPTKGGITLPALSEYLGRPATIEELVDHFVFRLFDHLGVSHERKTMWTGSAHRD